MLGYLHSRKGSRKPKHRKRLKILFDSGASHTLVNHGSVKFLEKQTDQEIWFGTKTGLFVTNLTCRLKFSLPAFHQSREITWNARVDERKQPGSIYDLIMGQDLMQAIGLILDFNK